MKPLTVHQWWMILELLVSDNREGARELRTIVSENHALAVRRELVNGGK